jgi:hypothetical protein
LAAAGESVEIAEIIARMERSEIRGGSAPRRRIPNKTLDSLIFGKSRKFWYRRKSTVGIAPGARKRRAFA